MVFAMHQLELAIGPMCVPSLLHVGQQRRHRQKERFLDSVGEGESGLI